MALFFLPSFRESIAISQVFVPIVLQYSLVQNSPISKGTSDFVHAAHEEWWVINGKQTSFYCQLIVWAFIKQKWQIFSGFSFPNVICCLFFSILHHHKLNIFGFSIGQAKQTYLYIFLDEFSHIHSISVDIMVGKNFAQTETKAYGWRIHLYTGRCQWWEAFLTVSCPFISLIS